MVSDCNFVSVVNKFDVPIVRSNDYTIEAKGEILHKATFFFTNDNLSLG